MSSAQGSLIRKSPHLAQHVAFLVASFLYVSLERRHF